MAFAAPIMPWLMAGASAVSGVMQIQSVNYQAKVAENNANLMAETAARERHAADQDMMDKDRAAAGDIAELQAQMGASGLNASSGTMLLRRQSAQQLVDRDRNRLAVKRDTQFENTKRQEAALRNEAKALKRSRGLTALTSLMSIPTSFLSGATMVNQYKAGRLALNNPSYSQV